MKTSKALKKIIIQWKLNMAQIATLSDLPRNAITRLVNETIQEPSIKTINQIADGLAKIDPTLRRYFFDLIEMSDDLFPELDQPVFVPLYDPASIAKIIKVLDEQGFIKPSLKKERKIWEKNNSTIDLPFETMIAVKLNNQELAENDQLEQVEENTADKTES